SNEPREVILEFMRAMKDDGIIITRDDIAYTSPVKRSEDSCDSEDDQSVSEDKGAEGTSTEAVVPKK
ncbi:hypothetical protein A2U01_0119101, partial [Trifolium medium]|nr:hypothetical protein [Trifolium medium]